MIKRNSTSTAISNVLKEHDICRPYLFSLSPLERTQMSDLFMTAYVRDVTIRRKKVVVKFMCDEKNLLWHYFKNKPSFKLAWLDRTGKVIDSMLIYGRTTDIYIEKISHIDTATPLIGVVEIERK